MPKRPADAIREPEQETPTKRARVEDGEIKSGNDIADAADERDAEMREAGAIDDRSARNGVIFEDDQTEEEEESRAANLSIAQQTAPTEGFGDLYLDTINRKLIDFDFEKLCSVTLSNINVYACLVCGKYFQGRGPKSQAYFHSLNDDHHVYINMETQKIYILPEGYEVQSSSLDDIKFQVDPRLPKEEVLRLDKTPRTQWDLIGRKHTPGFIGMNNIKANDYFNVVIQALAHVSPLRNYMMLEDLSSRPELAQRYAILVRKLWNPRAFRAHVSPHELLQEVGQRSAKKFLLNQQSDPSDFLLWFINNLHLALGGSKTKPGTSIVHRVFQGTMRQEVYKVSEREGTDRMEIEDAPATTKSARFMVLTIDLPAAPLFQDELQGNAIPQIPLTTVLEKYDGLKVQERAQDRIKYRLQHPLPPYMIFHIKRFSSNDFLSERNPTIVTFSPKGLDMRPYVEPNPKLHAQGEPIYYDLVANVVHEAVRIRDDSVEGESEKKVWKVQLRDKARDEWVEIQDLFIDKIQVETMFMKETYLQIWERRKTTKAK